MRVERVGRDGGGGGGGGGAVTTSPTLTATVIHASIHSSPGCRSDLDDAPKTPTPPPPPPPPPIDLPPLGVGVTDAAAAAADDDDADAHSRPPTRRSVRPSRTRTRFIGQQNDALWRLA